MGNSVDDRTLGTRVNVVADPTVRVLGAAGGPRLPRLLNGFTVGDMLKTRSPASKVVGLSFKDRAAILTAGEQRADGAVPVRVGPLGHQQLVHGGGAAVARELERAAPRGHPRRTYVGEAVPTRRPTAASLARTT